jgi:ketosteroid isomerase-like protein
MSTNRDALTTAYEAFDRGDIGTAFQFLDEECVFRAGSDLVPGGGSFHGKQDILGRWLPTIGATYENLRLTVEEMIGEGDAICVCGQERSTVAGKEIKSAFSHVWHFTDGMVTDARFHTGEAEVLVALQEREAAGIA